MASEWYYSHDGERHGPMSWDQLRALAEAGKLSSDDLVWNDGMENWREAGRVPGLIESAGAQPSPPPVRSAAKALDADGPARFDKADVSNKKLAAGICGILVGSLGIHKFILNLTTPALIMLLVTVLTCGLGAMVMGLIGLIEGIIYLTKSDEEFYQTYLVNKKGWF